MLVFMGRIMLASSPDSESYSSLNNTVYEVDIGLLLNSSLPATTPQHAAHIFLRNWTKKPCVSLPTGSRPVIAVRFCPQPFRLRITNPDPEVAFSSLFNLPYRWIFCLVLDDGLLFFDTQQVQPFAQVGCSCFSCELQDILPLNNCLVISLDSSDTVAGHVMIYYVILLSLDPLTSTTFWVKIMLSKFVAQ